MILEAETKQPNSVKSFGPVAKQLRAMKSYGPVSFASLTADDGSYIQVVGGRVTCLLEVRPSGWSSNRRAYLKEKKVPFDGTQVLMTGAGYIRHEPEELLFVEDIIACFEAFFVGHDFPQEIYWRDI